VIECFLEFFKNEGISKHRGTSISINGKNVFFYKKDLDTKGFLGGYLIFNNIDLIKRYIQ